MVMDEEAVGTGISSLAKSGRIRIAAWGLLAALLPSPSGASEADFDLVLFRDSAISFERFASSAVSDFETDSAGFLWIATDEGLFRFDGRNIIGLSRLQENGQLGPKEIYDIHIDAQQRLWIATWTSLSSYNLVSGELTRHSLPSMIKGYLTVVEGEQGRIWVGTSEDGILVLEQDASDIFRVVDHHLPTGRPGDLGATRVQTLVRLDDGRILAGQYGKAGILEFDSRTGEFSPLGPECGAVRNILQADDGAIWASIAGRRSCGADLIRIDPQGSLSKWNIPPLDPSKLSRVYRVIQTADGAIWAGGLNVPIARIDPTTDEVQLAATERGTPASTVDTLFEDHRGVVWIGSYSGLGAFFASSARSAFQESTDILPTVSRSDFGLPLEGGFLRSSLWHGISWLDVEGQEIASIETYTLAADRDGDTLWFLALDQIPLTWPASAALRRLSLSSREIQASEVHVDVSRHSSVAALGETGVLLGLPNGLFLARPGSSIPHLVPIGKQLQSSVFALSKAPDGEIWVAHETGVSRLSRELVAESTYPYPPAVPGNSSQQTPLEIWFGPESRTLWLLTPPGLHFLDEETGEFIEAFSAGATPAQAMPIDSRIALVEDAAGVLWFSVQGRIYSFDRKSRLLRSHSDWIDQHHYAAYLANDVPTFVGRRGTQAAYPNRHKPLYHVATVGLEGHDDGVAAARFARGLTAESSAQERTLRLRSDDLPVRIDFSVPDGAPSARLRYRIPELSEGSFLLGDSRQLSITQLPWGESHLIVQAASPGSVEWGPSLKLTLAVARPFWATIPFILLALSLFLFSGFALHRSRLTQLKKQRTWFSSTLNALREIVFNVDSNGVVRGLNLSARQLLQLSEQEAVGRRLADLVRIEIDVPGTRENAFPGINQDRTSIPFGTTLRLVEHDQEIAVSGSTSLVQLEGSKKEHVVALLDVTETLRMQEELASRRRLEAVGVLASGVAHDINNVLGGILLNAELLEMDSSHAKESTTAIRELVATASGVLEQIRSTWLHESAQGEPIDVNDVIRSTTAALRAKIRSTGSQAQLSLCEPPCHVLGHRPQLTAAISNLLLNACQAMPNGGNIRVETRYACPGATDVDVNIEDSGVGMSAEQLERCFEPFFSTRANEGGSGLGLFMVHEAVRHMGGSITVESNARGTRFSIRLPGCPPAHATVSPASQTIVRAVPFSILVVDDDTATRNGLRRVLEVLGCNVSISPSGAEALLELEQSSFDWVLLDLRMPGMNGEEVLARVLDLKPSQPVAVMSGWLDAETSIRLREAGVTSLLQKPISMTLLTELLGIK